jgi:FPC/CPF motif-containing protein YcgG
MSQNSTIYVAPGQQVRIFFDSPENCGLPAYNSTTGTLQKSTAQMWLESNTRLTASSGDPSSLNVAIMFVGSPTIPTGAVMSSNSDSGAACVQNFVIYAPRTNIELNSNSTYCGAIAGKAIHLDQNAKFNTDTAVQSFVLPNTAPHFITTKYVDCSTTAVSPPNANC